MGSAMSRDSVGFSWLISGGKQIRRSYNLELGMPTGMGQLGEGLGERAERKSILGQNQVSGACNKNDGH